MIKINKGHLKFVGHGNILLAEFGVIAKCLIDAFAEEGIPADSAIAHLKAVLAIVEKDVREEASPSLVNADGELKPLAKKLFTEVLEDA